MLAGNIDKNEAIFCLKHAQYAERTKYGTPPKELEVEKFQRIDNKDTDTQVNIMSCTRGRLVVAFPCTQTFKDVLTDMNADMEDHVIYCTKVRIHEGFLKAYKSVVEALYQAILQRQMSEVKQVYVTGYSLGGALSTICACDLSAMFKVKHISAGSPRVGDGSFAKLYNSLCQDNVRLVHRQDCYTTVPVKELGFFGRNFVHVGNLVHFDKDEIVTRPPRPWYAEAGRWFVKKVTSVLGTPLDISTAPDHALKNYLDALSRAI